MHREAGIDRAPEIVHLDPAARALDGDLGDACRQRVVLLHEGGAERASFALAVPVRHFGDRADERLHARLALRQLEPERDRVLARKLRDLVEEALDGERIVADTDAAP